MPTTLPAAAASPAARSPSPFPQVRDYHPDLPRLPVTVAKAAWSTLFVADFVLGLTDRPDSEGDVVRKTELPGLTGGAYRRLYDRIARDVERHLGARDFTEPLPVPSVDAAEFGPRDFARWRRNAYSPLVFRGMLKECRAVLEWSLQWLVEQRGEVTTRCVNMNDPSSDGRKMGVGQNVRLYDVPLRDFCLEDRYRSHYISNFTGIFGEEELREYCQGDRVDALRGAHRDLAQWFISRSDKTVSPLHCANSDNMFLNLKGTKEWHFLDPASTPVLLPALSRYAVYAVSELGELSSRTLDRLYETRPWLRNVPKLTCRLEEGDVLYNPPWWWHNVRNLTPFNIGCATRYLAHPANIRSSPQFHICQFLDVLKHPKRSFISRGIGFRYFKADRSRFMDSIYFKGSGARGGAASQAPDDGA